MNFYGEFKKHRIKNFKLDLGKIFVIFLKKSIKDKKNKKKFAFQTAVRKYVGIHEKS
jgi:hypothetical protein